jgi:preprotein translocase subunit SecA
MEAKILSKQIEGAQKKVEEQNFVMRKNVLKYDDVMNRHRQRIYEQRREVLEGQDLSEQIKLWIDDVIEDTVAVFTQEPSAADWDIEALTQAMAQLYQTEITAAELREDLGELSREAFIEEFQSDAADEYKAKEDEFGPDLMRELERFIVLQVVDVRWREHLENMEALREGIHLRSMAQKDPLVEYTQEGERMFAELGRAIRSEVVLHLFHAELAPEEAQQQLAQAQTAPGAIHYEHESSAGADVIDAALGGGGAVAAPPAQATVRQSELDKIGRNDPCWCGSGKKFKKCHGA